jgi:N-acetylglucosamine-6-sulfatase
VKTSIVGILALLAAVALLAGSAPAKPRPGQPNIVVVITDDMPALDGRLLDFMPTTKSVFRQQGVTFTDFHGESPQCCPGRVGFLSGQHTTNHGVHINSAAKFNPLMSIATQLQGAGYYTMLVGKYLNGYGRCVGINCAPKVPPGWSRWAAIDALSFYDYDMWVDGSLTPVHYGTAPEDYSTDVIANRAAELISSAPPDRPVFAWLAPASPHAPNQPANRHVDAPGCDVPAWRPPNYEEADVTDKPAWLQALPPSASNQNVLPHKCRMLLSVDELIAKARNALAARGSLNDTLFIFTGDNGMAWREHRLDGKGDPYQTQLPFLVSWPTRLGQVPRSIDIRLQNIDLAPTLCQIAGCTIGPYPNGQITPDGVSFRDLLLGTSTSLGRASVFEDMPAGNRPAPPWFSVTTTKQSALATTGCAAAASGGCLWQYTHYPKTGEEEVYDISNGPCWLWHVTDPGDPCKLQNVASDPAYAEVKAALRAELVRLRSEKGS